jgi:hypothetical protein
MRAASSPSALRADLVTLDHFGERQHEIAQRAQRERMVAEEVRAPDDALVGCQVDEQQRCLGHVPRGGADGRIERSDDGAGLHVTNLHGSLLMGALPATVPRRARPPRSALKMLSSSGLEIHLKLISDYG